MKSCVSFIVCIGLFFNGHHGLFSQTIDSAAVDSDSGKRRSKTPKAEHPFASLTIFVGKKKTSHLRDQILKRPGIIVHYLHADGMMSNAETVMIDPSDPKSVIGSIKFYGESRGDVILHLWADNEDVDIGSAIKAVQSLGGVEKRFKRFRMDLIFSKGTEELESNGKESGTGQEQE